MSEEMFDALLKIIDAKIQTQHALDSWDGGLHESIRESELINEFKEKFVVREED